MAFVKNDKNINRKGRPRKIIPSDCEQVYRKFVSGEIKYVQKNIHKLSLKDRAYLLPRLLPYYLPRLTTIEGSFDFRQSPEAFLYKLGELEINNKVNECGGNYFKLTGREN